MNDTANEERKQLSVRSQLKLCRANDETDKNFKHKNKQNEKLSTSTSTTSSLSPSILIALSDTTSSVPTHTHTHTYIQAYLSYMAELHTCMNIRTDIYVCLHVFYIVLLAALFLRSLWPFLSKTSSNFLCFIFSSFKQYLFLFFLFLHSIKKVIVGHCSLLDTLKYVTIVLINTVYF